jgi:hypothetical protein
MAFQDHEFMKPVPFQRTGLFFLQYCAALLKDPPALYITEKTGPDGRRNQRDSSVYPDKS